MGSSFVPPVKWLVGEGGLSVEDISIGAAPRGASVEGLSHSPKRGSGGMPASMQNNGNHPRLCLTPLTSEACLMEGVDPLDLFSRNVTSFTYGGADRSVAQLRAGAFERLRGDKLALVRAARAALMLGRLPASFGGGKAPPPVSSPRAGAGGSMRTNTPSSSHAFRANSSQEGVGTGTGTGSVGLGLGGGRGYGNRGSAARKNPEAPAA